MSSSSRTETGAFPRAVAVARSLFALFGRVTERHSLFPLFSTIVALAIAVTTLYLIRNELESGERAARRATADYTELYASQALRAIREIDLTLRLVQFECESRATEAGFSALQQHDLLPSRRLFAIDVIGVDGFVAASNQPGNVRVRADPALLELARSANGLVFAAPVRNTDGTSSLRFARAIHGPDRQLSGVVVLTVDADYFVSAYDPERLGEHGILGLISHDGLFLVKRAGNTVSTGEPASDAARFKGELEPRAAPEIDAALDGRMRFVGARPLGDLSVGVVAAPLVEEALSASRHTALRYVETAAVVSLLLAIVIGLAWRASWQLAQARRRELAEHQANAQRSQHLANHDALTGLPNRALFTSLLSQAIQRSRRKSDRLAVLFLDLDRFKVINDTLGHEAGDILLVEIAQRLSRCVRASDCVARLGGDEYVVLLDGIRAPADVEIVAAKMLEAVAAPIHLQGQDYRVTLSLGASLFPEHGSDPVTLMKHADKAMYQGKNAGKNQFAFFSGLDMAHQGAAVQADRERLSQAAE